MLRQNKPHKIFIENAERDRHHDLQPRRHLNRHGKGTPRLSNTKKKPQKSGVQKRIKIGFFISVRVRPLPRSYVFKYL